MTTRRNPIGETLVWPFQFLKEGDTATFKALAGRVACARAKMYGGVFDFGQVQITRVLSSQGQKF